MNSATPRLIGTAITIAIAAVKAVPQMKGSAPNTESGGDQRVVVKNFDPISPNTGSARRVIVMAMSPRINRTRPAAPAVILAKARSLYSRDPRRSILSSLTAG